MQANALGGEEIRQEGFAQRADIVAQLHRLPADRRQQCTAPRGIGPEGLGKLNTLLLSMRRGCHFRGGREGADRLRIFAKDLPIEALDEADDDGLLNSVSNRWSERGGIPLHA